GVDGRPDGDLVCDAAHAGQFANIVFSGNLFIIPVHVAAQCDPSVLNQNIDCLGGNENVPVQNIGSTLGNLIVRRLVLVRVTNLDTLGNRMHALDATSGVDRGKLFSVAVDVAGQGHDILVDVNADVLAVEAWIEFKFVDDILAKLRVGHDRPPFSWSFDENYPPSLARRHLYPNQ